MFFVDSNNKMINVNAIMILPETPDDALGGSTMGIRMTDGSWHHMYIRDIKEIRALVISRQLSPHTN